MLCITSKSNKKYKDKFILAIGGGSLIDKAKVYAKKHKKFLIAIPTTASGATETSHAVIWKDEKVNIQCTKPLSFSPPFKVNLSKKVRSQTTLDALGHIGDFMNVCSDNELIEIGKLAGRLISKRKTNLTHPMSYPLTLKYGIPHGFAVGLALKGLGIIK